MLLMVNVSLKRGGSSKIVKAKIVQLEEDDGSGPTKLIHDKFSKRGPFFSKYVVNM